jgi:hypothetical protein
MIEPSSRSAEIEAAIATYNNAGRKPRLPPAATRLLAIMFRHDDVCQRSLDDLAAEGIDRRGLTRLLRDLIVAGFLSKEQTSNRVAVTYTLHLPPQAQP